MTNSKLWMGVGIGIAAGVIVAGAAGVLLIDLMIPWDDICLTVAASHTVVEVGSSLIAQMVEWLDAADAFLATAPDDDGAPTGAAQGLSGLMDQARAVTGKVQKAAVNLVTMPLRALIEVARGVLSSVQESVDAARGVIESVDAARC